jgi:acetyl-CoA/propionyl-CoA carboxylase, biotin carboxylase, biotin carboxyl carrier protein
MESTLTGKRVAIANRGEIAIRIAATCRRLGAIPIALLGAPDLDGYAARQVGLVEPLGPAGSEFDVDLVLAAAKRANADFLHPGYGFLSERAALSAACANAGIRFVGPSPATLDVCGDKLATRNAATAASVPVLPASSPLGDDPASWVTQANAVGYPLLVKPAGAGGGRGLRRVATEAALVDAVSASRRESASSGAGDTVYLERELVNPRHIEVQVVADGTVTIALGDRDCSLQRRHQKVIEEAPAPNVSEATRQALHGYAVRIAEAVALRGIATCEFLLGTDGTIAFLEVNPRIQVEHPVTELVTGVDLVAWQLLIAAGNALPITSAPTPRGHAIEARVYAEDPALGFFPVSGPLALVAWPTGPGIRIDSGYATGDTVSTAYDAMLAKVIIHAPNREMALAALRLGLRDTVIGGLPTNLPWLLDLLADDATIAGQATTSTAETISPSSPDRTLALLAATARTLDRSDTNSSDPWAAIGPFRLSGSTRLTFHGADWETQIGINRTSGQWSATIDEETLPLHWWRDAEGIWTIAAGDQVARFAISSRGDAWEISGNGGRWTVEAGPRPAVGERKQRRQNDGRVKAPLPGKVLRINATLGDRVEAGHPVVTLSAMKMELVCEAPVTGIIESISCQLDQIVAADDVLATIQVENEETGPPA